MYTTHSNLTFLPSTCYKIVEYVASQDNIAFGKDKKGCKSQHITLRGRGWGGSCRNAR